MIMRSLGSAYKYAKQGKYNELLLRGSVFFEEQYGALRYALKNRVSREKYKIVKVNGFPMYIYLEDNGISRDLYLYRKREKFAVEFFESFVREDDVIIDIGANIGYYVLLEQRLAKRGRVFACEPSPFNRSMLSMNLALNKVGNVKVFPLAIGSEDNVERDFFIYDRINWASFNRKLNAKLVKTIKVKIATIDRFVEENLEGLSPSLLRMDVEGHEYDILRGASRVLAQCPRLKIFMEIHPHLLSEDALDGLLRILESYGFRVEAIINECEPYFYRFLNNKTYAALVDVPYGFIGDSYEKLRTYLRMNKGSEVFFQRA